MEVSMQAIVVSCLLLLSACTIREETFAPRDDADSSGMSFNPPELNAPSPRGDDRSTCPGGFAQGSSIDEYRDGSANLFCD
jgi:hypothetical protein